MSSDRNLSDHVGHLVDNPPWLERRMQRVAAANAHDADDLRTLLGALGLDHPIDEEGQP